MSRRSYDPSNVSPEKESILQNRSEISRTAHQGVGCSELLEPVPNFNEAPCETVHSGKNNSFIVLGRDRPSSRLSGYGGLGHMRSSMIDIVVGRMGTNPEEEIDGSPVYSDPNFTKDSARIYISQKTDVDKNFSLADGSSGASKARSAIGIKADDIRIIGRESIKLVTRTDQKNSQGNSTTIVNGIDLIAGNDDTDLQPIPKGKNLILALNDMVSHVMDLSTIVGTVVDIQMDFNKSVAGHWHHSPFQGVTSTSPTVEVKGIETMTNILTKVQVDLYSYATNLQKFKSKYLSSVSSKYINSNYNNVN